MKDTKADLYFNFKKGRIQAGFYPFLYFIKRNFSILLVFSLIFISLSAEAQSFVANKNVSLPPLSIALSSEYNQNFILQDKDSVEIPKKKEKKFIKPGLVALMSTVLPGSGQVVNGQALKVPVFYGMLAGAGYLIHINEQDYQDYRFAYKQRIAGERDKYYNIYTNNKRLLDARENAHRNRDLSAILFIAIYTANILDAYVYAHLHSFDVSDDLSLQVNPTNLINIAGQNYYAASITLKFK